MSFTGTLQVASYLGDLVDPSEIPTNTTSELNEIAIIAPETMNEYQLIEGFLKIQSAEREASISCKVVTLISLSDGNLQYTKDCVYMNHPLMDTLRVTKFDKVHVMNMEKDKVGTAECVTFCRFDDGSTDPPSRKWALQQYLTPYYQLQPTENCNFVVTKRETMIIDGQKFQIKDFNKEKKENVE